MLTVTKSCMQGLTFIGWGCHIVGIIMLIYSMVTQQWLYWPSKDEYQGIFPCCPSFKCGRYVETGMRKDSTLDVVIGLIIFGLVLVTVGGIFSITHAFCTWRKTSKTLFGMLYLSVAVVGAGALILLGTGLLFAIKIPNQVQQVLSDECTGHVFNLDSEIDTGLSFKTYLAAGVLFFLATLFIFLGGPRRRKPLMQGVLMEGSNGMPNQIPLNTLMQSQPHPQYGPQQQTPGTEIYPPPYEEHATVHNTHSLHNNTNFPNSEHVERDQSLLYEPPPYEPALSDAPPPYKERV